MSVPTALRRSFLFAIPRITPLRPTTLLPARRWASSDDAPANGGDAPANAAAGGDAPPPAPAKKPVSTPMADIANLLQSTSPRATRSASGFPFPTPTETTRTPITANHDYDPLAGFSLQDLTTMPSLNAEEEYHLHIYSHKHNTHITFTNPEREAIVCLSAGNIGFRKSHRGTYDAAYQLAAHVFKAIEDKNIRPKGVEVILRGFGQGREAVVKALLGQEGRHLRPVIRRVTDSTRLKFGGTRSKAPRRLG